MNTLTGSLTGQIHLISGIFALIFGGTVLLMKRERKFIEKWGIYMF